MTSINSEGIYNIHMKNVIFVIRTRNNLSMSTSIIMSKLYNTLKNLTFIVKSVPV